MAIDVKTLMMKSAIFTYRQLDLIYGDIEKLHRQPSKAELRTLVNLCNDLYDYDTLSLLNVRFDLSDIFEGDEMEPVSPQQIQKAEQDFVAFMQSIDSDFQMPDPIPTDKTKHG